ncbi:hypothetical protein ARUE_c20810 [Arthrobacter sp. Rue61a]|nr:hypothetical protein ARUE_c20810 [Arthrobacter sp. Rue61a]
MEVKRPVGWTPTGDCGTTGNQPTFVVQASVEAGPDVPASYVGQLT